MELIYPAMAAGDNVLQSIDSDTALARMRNYTFLTSIDLGGGVKTPGRPAGGHKQAVLRIIDSMDLAGKRVADLGCANGLYSLAAAARGSAEVIAVDNTTNNIDSLNNIIIPYTGAKITPWHMNVLALDPERHGRFDVVICAGLLYHLRYPFWSLRVITGMLNEGGELVLETAILEDFNTSAMLFYPIAKDSPYGKRSCTFLNERALCETLGSLGLTILSRFVSTPPMRRMLKKVAGNIWPGYRPISRIVLRCQKTHLADDADFWEGVRRR